jgi:hypothetical protein
MYRCTDTFRVLPLPEGELEGVGDNKNIVISTSIDPTPLLSKERLGEDYP